MKTLLIYLIFFWLLYVWKKYIRYLVPLFLGIQLAYYFWRFFLRELREIPLENYLSNYLIIVLLIKGFLYFYKVYKFHRGLTNKSKTFIEEFFEEVEVLKRKLTPIALEFYLYRNINFFSSEKILLVFFLLPFFVYIILLFQESQYEEILKYSILFLAINSVYQRVFISFLNVLFYSNFFKLYSNFQEKQLSSKEFKEYFFNALPVVYDLFYSGKVLTNTFDYLPEQEDSEKALICFKMSQYLYSVYFFNLTNLNRIIKKYSRLRKKLFNLNLLIFLVLLININLQEILFLKLDFFILLPFLLILFWYKSYNFFLCFFVESYHADIFVMRIFAWFSPVFKEFYNISHDKDILSKAFC